MTISWLARRRGAEGARRACPSLALRLECLEDRSVPATFNVTTTLDVVNPADGKRSLREAITAASQQDGDDVIAMPAGVYRIARVGTDDNQNETGDFDMFDPVTIRGAGAGSTIIDGQRLDRVFDVFGPAMSSNKMVLQGLTVRNGNVNGHGGGIRVSNADLIMRDCIVTGNRASLSGGGISNGFAPGTADVKLVRTTVGGNVAGGDGGGLTVIGNSTLTLDGSTVRRNFAGKSGGGITATAANLTRSTVSGNTAGSFGGGINATEAFLSRSTVSGNSAAADGGGIFAAAAYLTNCTVSGNTAVGIGGGIWTFAGSLLSCTIAENIAQSGGGVVHNPLTGQAYTVWNTIIALNLVGFTDTSPDVSGAFTGVGFNLIGDATGATGFTNGTSGSIVGTSLNPVDPKLGPLASNGGKTKTHALQAGSQAIDRGDSVGTLLMPVDQRGAGFSRTKDGNFNGVAIVDIGAFER